MTKRAALVSALLVAGLVVAVVGATAALRLIGIGAFGPGGQPMSQADVQQALAAQQASPAPQPTASATARHTPRPGHPSQTPGRPTPSPVTGNFGSGGGMVSASCSSGLVTLTSWSPALGFLTDGVARGPAASAWVKFKSSGSEITVTAFCASGHPHFSTAADDRHGGGGGDDGGGGGGGSGKGGGGH
jgi:hypothetical protein